MSLIPSISTTQRSPGTDRTSRSSLARALGTEQVLRMIMEDSVAADPRVDDADGLGVRASGQPLRQPVGPAMVGVDFRAVAVGDRVAERDDDRGLAGRIDINLIDEESRCRSLGRGDRRRPR